MVAMNLQVGDCVHYGAHGVCRVCGREAKDFGSSKREYFALRPTGNENILLYLPVDAEPVKVKLRRLLSRKEILELVHGADQQPIEWIADSKVRREAWTKTLRSGDTAQLLDMVRALHVHEAELPEGKQLPMSDQEMMHVAERQLYDEFSYVLHMEAEQVMPLILGQVDTAALEQEG